MFHRHLSVRFHLFQKQNWKSAALLKNMRRQLLRKQRRSVPLNKLKDSTKKSIRVASLGSSDNAKVGQMVIAIGNALGYGQSVTALLIGIAYPIPSTFVEL